MGTTNIRIEFANSSDAACVLLGHPDLAGIAADGTITGLNPGHGSILGDAPWPAANISPGQTAALNISSSDACDAIQRGERRVYPTLRITLPSGDAVDVASNGFDTVCGVSVSQFGVPAYAQPPDEPPPSPLTAQLDAPASARPGEDLDYTITLTNTGDTTYSLSPCPAYEEYVVAAHDDGSIHPNYYLNCDTVSAIPPGAAVTYEMRLQLPADIAPGSAKFGWFLQGEVGPGTAEVLQITS